MGSLSSVTSELENVAEKYLGLGMKNEGIDVFYSIAKVKQQEFKLFQLWYQCATGSTCKRILD